MSKLHDLFLTRVVRIDTRLRTRLEALRSNPESGLDDAPWKAIFAVGGAILAVTIIGLVTAFVNGYFSKLPG
ncbi:hypothetical protein [Clavibacter nebraskensis]|uniref:hypothetical protein n=1 Tax=Clavibacter nebraskensis TaxID=31963 RepID=UPI003F4BAD5F